MDKIIEAAKWAAQLFEERTIQASNGTCSIYHAHPAYRVSWHEIVQKFPELGGPVGRKDFQPAFDKEIKRRGLWKVLKGKEKSNEWAERNKRS